MKTCKITIFLFFILSTIFSYSQNNALEFDGSDDYVTIEDNTELDLSASYTIEFWVNTSSNSATYQWILNKTVSDADENYRIGIIPSSNTIYFDYGGEGQYAHTTAFNINTNTWYHMAFSVTAGSVGHIYVNGVEATSYITQATAPNPLLTNNNDLELARLSSYTKLTGQLDELRIWNDIRTESEIRQNMYRELPNASSETNLVAYYKFNETSGTTTTDSKGSNDGTLTNMSGNEWQTSPAMFGPKNCLDFDGDNDYVDISSLHLSGSSITIETWVYLREFGDPNTDANIANLFKGGDENIVLRIGDGGMPQDMPQFVVNIGGHQRLNANARISLNTWYHLAGVYDGHEMKLYINGKLDKSQFQSGSIATTSSAFGLGGIDRYLNGQMDEMRIWNTARTETQIRENMCKNLTGNEYGLLAYYSADNKSGNSLQDLSGNEHDGTLNNMTDSDWTSSSAFNMWMNTADSDWSTSSNWSRGTKPTTESVGIGSFSGGVSPSFDNNDEAGANHMVVNMSTVWSLGGNLDISGNLFTESDINLNGKTITLGSSAYLVEDEGRIYGNSGSITTTRSLSNINENIAGLGAEITTSANLGSTTISRSHAAASSPTSIQRRFSISPTNNSSLNASVVFHYNDEELNGLTESYLELARSTNGGSSWTDQNGSVNTFYNTITLSGIDAFSLWTAVESDEVNPPILETQNPVHDYTQNSAAIYVAPNTTVTTSSNLENATVSISPIISGDILSASSLPAGLEGNWDNSTKIFSITGTASASDYQTALRNIQFFSSASSEDTRIIDFILGDGVGLMINGEQHYYEVIDNGSSISWTNARANALACRFGLAQGYLATVTSAEENDYLAEKVTADTWIGGTDSEVEGVWRWIDGPEAYTQFWLGDLNAGNSSTTNYGSSVNGEYANWNNNEPNNAYSSYGEDCAHMYGSNSGQPGYWNDYYNGQNVQYYIVEYGGDGSSFTTIDNATIVVNGVSWTGSVDSDWSKAGNWNSESVPDLTTDILIPNVANDPIIYSGTGANCNNLSLSPGAQLTIESGGSLITNGSISNNGSIQVKKTISQGQWHMISTPISSALSGIFAGDYLQTFSEEDDWWYEINATDVALTPAKGYGLWSNGSGNKTYTFSGTPNTGNLNIALSAQGSGGSHNRANLVGNPYPSSIDWDEISYSGAVYLYNGTAYESFTSNKNIAPGQGFFVVPETSGTFSLTNNCRTHADANTFYKNHNLEETGIILSASNGSYQDKLSILLNENYSEYFEQAVDAWKFETSTPGISQLWSKCPDGKLSIDSRPPQNMIELGFKNDIPGTYSIDICELNAVSSAELEDTKLNIFHDLTKGAYSFDWNSSDSEERFILHLNATGTVELETQEAHVYTAFGQVYIRLNDNDNYEEVIFYDLAGRKIMENSLSKESLQSFDFHAYSGTLLVQLKGKLKIRTKKVSL